MNYYVEMIKDFVMAECRKPGGALLDDGEFAYACGIAFTKLMRRDRKPVVAKKRMLIQQIETTELLKIELTALIQEKEKEEQREFAQEEWNLFEMIKGYQPLAKELDAVLKDTLEEALAVVEPVNKYARQEKYSKKAGIVSKTYKLNEQVVNDFAQACKERGVSLGPTLTQLMQQFIDS